MTNFLFLAPFRFDSVKSLIQLPIFNYLCLTPSSVRLSRRWWSWVVDVLFSSIVLWHLSYIMEVTMDHKAPSPRLPVMPDLGVVS